MRYLISFLFIIVGIIHLLPLAGVLGPDRLQSLYGVALTDPSLILLMRHRAVLFGILGAFIVFSAFHPALQLSALVLGGVSVVSFLTLSITSVSNGLVTFIFCCCGNRGCGLIPTSNVLVCS